jgi:hypothetical protein
MPRIDNEPSGLGGWLILPMLGLLLSPLTVGFMLVSNFVPLVTSGEWRELTDPDGPAYHPLWGPLLGLEVAGNLFFIGYALILLALLFKKSHRFPMLYIAFQASNLVFVATDMIFSNMIPAVAAQPDAETTKELIRAIVGAAIWIPYMLVSKRVKNTFVKPDEETLPHDDEFD